MTPKKNTRSRTWDEDNNVEGQGNPDIALILEHLRQQTANLAHQQKTLTITTTTARATTSYSRDNLPSFSSHETTRV